MGCDFSQKITATNQAGEYSCFSGFFWIFADIVVQDFEFEPVPTVVSKINQVQFQGFSFVETL